MSISIPKLMGGSLLLAIVLSFLFATLSLIFPPSIQNVVYLPGSYLARFLMNHQIIRQSQGTYLHYTLAITLGIVWFLIASVCIVRRRSERQEQSRVN